MADQRGVPDLSQYKGSAESYYRLRLEAGREADFRKRVTAQWGLIARGRESLPYLISMLNSADPDAREDAGGALEWLGTDSGGVVSELLAALERETEHQPRDTIIMALGRLRSRAAIPALAALIRAEDTDGDTRRQAVESLGRIVRQRFDRRDDPEAAAIAWLDQHGHGHRP